MADPVIGAVGSKLAHTMLWVPFIGLAAGGNANSHLGHPLFTRLAEAAIIGGIALFGTVKMLDEKIDNLQTGQARVEIQVEKLSDRIQEIDRRTWRPGNETPRP